MLSNPAGYRPQKSEGQESPTILRKDEQLLCDLPLEAAVIRGLGAGRCSGLCRGLQRVVGIVDDLRGRHGWPGSIDVCLPLGLALGSPIFPSGCEGKLGVALESLQGLRDLT